MLLLRVARPRVVHRDGIHFEGQRYLALTLAGYIGETVTIRYDPRDLAEIGVYHHDRFVCRAVSPELAAQTISLKDLQARAAPADANSPRSSPAAASTPTSCSPPRRTQPTASTPCPRPWPRRAHAGAWRSIERSKQVSTATPTAPAPEFLITKEHRRFIEFADAVRHERYIGVCYGAPGVGKTASARRYAHWDTLQPWLAHHRHDQDTPAILEHARTVLYTPTTYIAARKLDEDLHGLCRGLDWAIQDHRHPDAEYVPSHQLEAHVELVIVDEADRLKTGCR